MLALHCETSRRFVESSSGVSASVAVTCRIGRYWQCKQCRHFTAACKDWILCPRGNSGYKTRITTNNTPEHGNVCVLVLALSHAKYCNNDCIRQQSWLTHCVSPHYPGGRWLVTSWQWSCVRDSVTRRDANCGNIIYSGHTYCRLRHTAHPRSN